MGRLNKSITYLCGQMDKAIDGGVGWRNYIKPKLHKMGILTIDPCDKPVDQGKEDANTRTKINNWKEEEKYDLVVKEVKLIRNMDLRFCDLCHYLIVNLDLNTHPTGTYEEIFWVNRMKKPVIVRCEQGKKNMPNWLFGTLRHEMFFDTWEQVFDYLKLVDEGKAEDLGRWMFFDWEKLHKETQNG